MSEAATASAARPPGRRAAFCRPLRAGIPIPAALRSSDPDATHPMPRVLLKSSLGAAVRLALAFAGPDPEQARRLVEAVRVQSSVSRLLGCGTTVEIVVEGE